MAANHTTENTMVLQSETTTLPWYHHSNFEKYSKRNLKKMEYTVADSIQLIVISYSY